MVNILSPRAYRDRSKVTVHTPQPVVVRSAARRLVDTRRKSRRKRLLLLGVVLVFAVTAWWLWRPTQSSPSQKTQVTTPSAKIVNTDKTPKFATILPKNKTISDFGGWTRVSPETSGPVFGYRDMLDGSPILVSEQPLPDSFHDNLTKSVENFAASFNATEKLTVSDTTVYVATASDNSQSLVFTKSNLLVLIKSPSKHTSDAWVGYISQLGS